MFEGKCKKYCINRYTKVVSCQEINANFIEYIYDILHPM